jgi:hypothetical protein
MSIVRAVAGKQVGSNPGHATISNCYFRRRLALPSEGKVTRSNRVGCASFSLFYNAICRLSLRLQSWFIRASKQLGENFYTRLNWRSQCRSVQFIERKLFGLGRASGS